MRYLIGIILAGFLLVPATAAAQANGGIIGGPGVSGVAAENDNFADISKVDVSYSLGIQGQVTLHEFVGLKTEILYSHRPWTSEGQAFGQEFQTNYNLYYIEVPLLVRLAIPVGDMLAPKLIAGPHMGVFLDGNINGKTSGPFFNAESVSDIDSEDVNSVQWGVTAGVGMDFNVDPVVITSDIRYVRNFTPVFEDSDDGQNIQHQSWMLMVGLMF